MITATFNDLKFENIEGYRISCRLTKGQGFDGHFYVYIDERRQAQTPFGQPAKVSVKENEGIKAVRGTLELSDEDMSYQFRDIDLNYAELGATRSERTRYFEFRYDPRITDGRGADPITISGKRSNSLGPCGLGSDYKGGLGESRHLLGFRAYVGAHNSTVVRFANLGCMPKSFLEKVVELNKDMQSSDRRLPPFTVKFSQGDFEVTKDNLMALYVEESRGSLSLEPTTPVHRIIESPVTAAIERLRPNEHTANDLLWYDKTREFSSREVVAGTVEIATLVFDQGGEFSELTVR